MVPPPRRSEFSRHLGDLVSLTWYEARTASRRGVAVVVHGLNNDPAVMDPLATMLAKNGVECCRLSLYGGYNRNSSPEQVKKVWLSRMAMAREQASDRAGSDPVLILGYSLGALVAIASLDRESEPVIDRMALIAPPVALTRIAGLVRYLVFLSKFGVVLPSAAPRSVRQRWGTPLNEYAAMLDLSDSLKYVAGPGALSATPTRVFAVPDDELVDLAGLRSWVAKNNLGLWSVSEVKDRQPEKLSYSHLLVTEPSLGESAWNWLQRELIDHLLETS